MDEEPLKYIGYSMAKKKWFIVKPANKRSDTYEFLNSGATSLVYYNNASNRVVKIIRGSEYTSNDSLIKKCEKEVAYQSRAADFGLAPKVFHHGFIEKNDSFLYPDDKIPYYYILMESLSENNGWEQVYATENPELFCKFINDLVDKVGIINTEDPHAHFFYNERKDKLLMIDYDRCIDCSDKNKCKIDMANALGITCLSGGVKKRKSIKQKTTKKRKSIKRKNTKKKKTIKRRN